jgi:hypothetical protein
MIANVLIVSNRPLSDLEAACFALQAEDAAMDVMVVKPKPFSPERTEFLTEVAHIWKARFDAL